MFLDQVARTAAATFEVTETTVERAVLMVDAANDDSSNSRAISRAGAVSNRTSRVELLQ